MIYKKLVNMKINAMVYFWKFINYFLPKYFKLEDSKVIFIIEKADWAIRQVGTNIAKRINKNNNIVKLSTVPERFNNKIIHFGSHYMWLLKYKNLSMDNKYIVSFFHGNPEYDENEKKIFDEFLKSVYKINKIIVSNSIVKNRLINHGISKKKIIQIPIGVDTNYFKPPTKLEKMKARTYFNFKNDEIIIGSFQKDGQGWGNGTIPKLIKGPDIFAEVIAKLSQEFKIKVLLTGPARGFLKKQLGLKNIKFIHHYLNDYSKLLKYYHALDLYLITSREEGGPMGLLESMAAGVPVISTNVGMAPDLINSYKSGLIVDSFEPNFIASKLKLLIHNEQLNTIKYSARKVIKKVDWETIASKHMDKVYSKI